MSGKIKLKKRLGLSKDSRYKDYCEWYIEVTDEDTHKVISCSPKVTELSGVLKQIIEHEINNDNQRKRNGDAGLKAFDFIYSLLLPLRKDQQTRVLNKLKRYLSTNGTSGQGRL